MGFCKASLGLIQPTSLPMGMLSKLLTKKVSAAAMFAALTTLAGCSKHELPPEKVLAFESETRSTFLLCELKTKSAVMEGQGAQAKALMRTLKALSQGIAAPRNDSQAAALAAAQTVTKDCIQKQRPTIEARWAEARAVVNGADASRLAAFQAAWSSAIEGLTPTTDDLRLDFKTPADVYVSRTMALYHGLDQPWAAYVQGKMPLVQYCVNELPKLTQEGKRVSEAYGVKEPEFDVIRAKSLRPGLSKCATMAVWGTPAQTSTLTDSSGVREQLTFDGKREAEFKNGKLVSFRSGS